MERVLDRFGANQRDSEPPKPIILSGWWYSEDSDKAQRLKEQIAFASHFGILETADRFLRSLKLMNGTTKKTPEQLEASIGIV